MLVILVNVDNPLANLTIDKQAAADHYSLYVMAVELWNTHQISDPHVSFHLD
jgi:hypothetical protein